MNKDIIKYALINAGATTAYILFVVFLLFTGEGLFGSVEPEDNFLIPVIMLMLFVVSATITASTVLGRSVLWYLDGRKKEALMLLAYTLSFLVIILFFIILVIL